MDIQLPLKYINSRLEPIYNNWLNFYIDPLKESKVRMNMLHLLGQEKKIHLRWSNLKITFKLKKAQD